MIAEQRERTARTEVLHVRLSRAEQEALRLIAARRDLHIGQAVRHLIREASSEAHGGAGKVEPRDGHAG